MHNEKVTKLKKIINKKSKSGKRVQRKCPNLLQKDVEFRKCFADLCESLQREASLGRRSSHISESEKEGVKA